MFSLLFGAAAMLFAIAPFIPDATGGRFVISTVGLTAVFAGIQAFRLRRRRSARGVAILGALGIGGGALATVVMLATWLSVGPVWTAAAPEAPQQAVVPPAAEPSAPAPAAPSAPTIGAMEETLGTLASTMNRIHVAGTAWPALLQVAPDGAVSVPGTTDVLVRLPAGTQLGYRTSTDGSAYAVRISDTRDPRRYVDYDTDSGVVTPGSESTQ